MSRPVAVQKPLVSPARALLTHWYPVSAPAYLLSDHPCMHTPRWLETESNFLGSDSYGMLEVRKHIPWCIHCSQAGKRPDIT
jgi:hypothetical protein